MQESSFLAYSFFWQFRSSSMYPTFALPSGFLEFLVQVAESLTPSLRSFNSAFMRPGTSILLGLSWRHISFSRSSGEAVCLVRS